MPAHQQHVDSAQSRLRGMRALVAEDNPVNQMLLRRQLIQLGLEVDIVDNGRQVLEALQRTPYELLLTDCDMPELDGLQMTVEIRSREASGIHLWIIAVTAREGREDCIAAGMDDYIAKPVTKHALHRALAHFERWKAARTQR